MEIKLGGKGGIAFVSKEDYVCGTVENKKNVRSSRYLLDVYDENILIDHIDKR